MSVFQQAKEDHEFYGHGSFVEFMAIIENKNYIWIQNICTDLGCKEIISHVWEGVLFKNSPAMKCKLCGFVWQPHMNRPKVTCEKILNNPKPRKNV